MTNLVNWKGQPICAHVNNNQILWFKPEPRLKFGHENCRALEPENSAHYPDSKVHGANMGPTWVLAAPDGPHVGPMSLAIREGFPDTILLDDPPTRFVVADGQYPEALLHLCHRGALGSRWTLRSILAHPTYHPLVVLRCHQGHLPPLTRTGPRAKHRWCCIQENLLFLRPRPRVPHP